MTTIVLGLAPYLDKERFREPDPQVFADDHAFLREGALRCFTPNLAAIAVTTCLQRRGFAAEYLDLALEFGLPLTARARARWLERIRARFAELQPDNVFISCVSATEHVTLREVAATVRAVSPRTVIGVGSYHANALREELLAEIPELDFVFLGDIEPAADELMARIGAGPAALAAMGNVVTRADPAPGAKRPLSEPSESHFSYRSCERYLPFYDSMPVIGMKGCPFQCAFCQEKAVRPGYHQRDPRAVVAEAIENYAAYEERMGHRRVGYSFMEPIFGFDREWTHRLLDAIEASGLQFFWGAQTRVGQLDGTLIARMARLGCRIVFFGVESFSPRMLLRMNKTTRPDQYLQAFDEDLAHCSAAGISVEANILFGYPGETAETLAETERRLAALLERHPGLAVNLNLFRPLPGTRGLGEAELGDGARLLAPGWWKRGVAAGVTVMVQPSAELGPSKLLEFFRSIYDLANCYQRRGVNDGLVRLMQLEELGRDELLGISEAIRQKLWQLTRTTPPHAAEGARRDVTGRPRGADA